MLANIIYQRIAYANRYVSVTQNKVTGKGNKLVCHCQWWCSQCTFSRSRTHLKWNWKRNWKISTLVYLLMRKYLILPQDFNNQSIFPLQHHGANSRTVQSIVRIRIPLHIRQQDMFYRWYRSPCIFWSKLCGANRYIMMSVPAVSHI